MQTSTDLLAALQVRGIRFLRDPSVRVLHAVIPPWMRAATPDIITGLAQRPEATGPLLVLNAEAHEDADHWRGWSGEIRERYVAWRGDPPDVAHGWKALPESPIGSGLVGFAEQLGQLILARPSDGAEVVVVLVVDPASPLVSGEQVLGLLINSPPLQPVRWIIVELGVSTLEVGAMVGGEIATVRSPPEGIEPPRVVPSLSEGTRSGRGAHPDGLALPRRPREPTARTPDPTARRSAAVARHALAGSDALGDGRADEAIEQQCCARDQAIEGLDVRSNVTMELVLGGHLLAAGAATQAESSYMRAVTIAKDGGDAALAVVAQLALGSSRLVRGDKPAALVALADAAASANQAESQMLTVEACRLTGDVALELGMEGQAVAFWCHAIKCGRADPAMASSPSVERCAHALESLCERCGLKEQATSLLEAPAAQGTSVASSTSIAASVDIEAAGAPESPGTVVLREWSEEEREILTRSSRAIVDQEATSLLTPDEIASLHGWTALPAPRQVPSRTVMLDAGSSVTIGEELLRGDTEWLDPDELKQLRERSDS